jgi:hypothetical protein
MMLLRIEDWNQRRAALIVLAICLTTALLSEKSAAQVGLPFEVSNPKHLNWSVEEASRIYASACDLVSRALRLEKPAQLQPRFLLVLGAKSDQAVRTAETTEIHLKKWDPARFAEAMVILSLRKTTRNEDVLRLTRETLNVAEASVTVQELRQGK